MNLMLSQNTLHTIQAPIVQHLLKKLPKADNLRLKFEGETALQYLELRKLGLLSKKIFGRLKGLNLEYNGSRTLRNRHLGRIAKHLTGNLRKVKDFSVRFGFGKGLMVNMIPLLKSLKHNFAGLVSLKLSVRIVFGLSLDVLYSFERLFAKVKATLRNLDLDFSVNKNALVNFPEALGQVIMKHLSRLESLSLNFERTGLSTRVVRLLIHGACTHLVRLRSLDLSVGSCYVRNEDWNCYKRTNFRSNLEYLNLNFQGCGNMSISYLSVVQQEIMRFCPGLRGLYIWTLNCTRFSNEYYFAMEREFLQGLMNLRRFKIFFSNEMENLWKGYENMQGVEFEKAKEMEEEVLKIKEFARNEEEVDLYLETMKDTGDEIGEEDYYYDEQEHLQDQFECELFVGGMIEIEEQQEYERGYGEEGAGLVEEEEEYLRLDPQGEGEYESEYDYEDENRERMLVEVCNLMEEEQAEEDYAEAEIRCRELNGEEIMFGERMECL